MPGGFSKKAAVRQIYETLAQATAAEDRFVFMNYGYAAEPPVELAAEYEPHRFAVQLYHQLAAEIELADKDVLEVGSGRGGGAAFVTRTFSPRSYLGVDLSDTAVAICNHVHDVAGLSFEVGDAERLPLDDEAFDVVMNVESSHGYGSMPRFVSEVTRVLRPQGTFLISDLRDTDALDTFFSQLTATGLVMRSKRDITSNVVAALGDGRETEYRLSLGEKFIPGSMMPQYEAFAGKKGTANEHRLRTGEMTYLSIVLEKQS